MDELSKRNFTALADGLQAQRDESSKQAARITQLESLVVGLRQDIEILRGQVSILMAKGMGTGPTTR
jgi:hypothetical protein